VKAVAGANAATAAPQATPITAGKVQSLITPGITAPFGAVGKVGADCRRHDDGDRGADAKLHAYLVRHAEHAKNLEQDRHDDRAATDAEQAGEQSGDHAADDDHEREPEEFMHTDADEHCFSLMPRRPARNDKPQSHEKAPDSRCKGRC